MSNIEIYVKKIELRATSQENLQEKVQNQLLEQLHRLSVLQAF